jgi:hypothetical protein
LEHQIRHLRASAKSESMVERVRMAEQVASAISVSPAWPSASRGEQGGQAARNLRGAAQRHGQTRREAGLDRHIEAAFSMLLARKRPPGGLQDAAQALEALDVTRLQNLLQSTKGRLRHSGLSAKEMEDLQHKVMELNSRLKESLDRLRGPPNSPPASSQK